MKEPRQKNNQSRAALLAKKISTTILLSVLFCLTARAEDPLRVPGFTAYQDPFTDGGRHRRDHAKETPVKVLWFGELKHAGKLDCAVALHLAEGHTMKLRLTVAGKSSDATATGTGGVVTVPFGTFEIASPAYEKFTLESMGDGAIKFDDLDALVLSGPATEEAHFNLKERRNAASVHLSYPTTGFANIDAFYCEVTGVEDPLWTYYMACGWRRGYFGMQVNSATERRIIFSVWDSGNEAVDRSKVNSENRVTLVAKGEGVDAGDFGNEGTGGHSHLVYPWKTGEKQRFLMTAKLVGTNHTIYSGYYFHPEQKKWMLISSWNAPHDGKYLSGLYSFSENFGGDNGHLRRKALYGNQWIRTADGEWHELTTASFSHDPTGKADRLDRFMGVEDGQFFLSHGGFIPGYTKFGEKFTRAATGKSPSDIVLPPLPQ